MDRRDILMSIQIMQGDQYGILFSGTSDGDPLDLSRIERIEFCIGRLCKCWPEDVQTDEDGNFVFPLTQEDTFNLRTTSQPVQIRVKFTGGDEATVAGTNVGSINVMESISKVVL